MNIYMPLFKRSKILVYLIFNTNVMEAYKLREKLIQEISMADENLLKIVEDAIDVYQQSHPVIVSEPISLDQYNKELDIADEQFENGDVFTQDEVSELVKRWGRK
jgi:hypothetical protein